MTSCLSVVDAVGTAAMGKGVLAKKRQQVESLAAKSFDRRAYDTDDQERNRLIMQAKSIRIPGVTIDRFLAKGSVGVVFLGVLDATKELVVVKMVDSNTIRTMQAQLRKLSMGAYMLSFLNTSTTSAYNDFKAHVEAETNLAHEAQVHAEYYALMAKQSFVRIPRVHTACCQPHTLVSEYLTHVKPVYEFEAGSLPPDIVKTIGDKLYQGFYFGMHSLMLHADITPGNVLINDKGEVALIDFGCLKKLTPHEHAEILRLRSLSLLPLDEFRKHAHEFFVGSSRPSEADVQVAWSQIHSSMSEFSREEERTAGDRFGDTWFEKNNSMPPIDTLLRIQLRPSFTMLLRSIFGISAIFHHIGYTSTPPLIDEHIGAHSTQRV